MKKILGLDLGTNSIGWAIISASQVSNNYSILALGVRIIPLSSDENDEFTKGNAISKNANRTLKRSARRNLQRYKLRRQQLVAKLKLLGMLPEKTLFGLDALSLYGLRTKALTEQLTLQEIGRILFHLNQKRGYKSSRKANNEEDQEQLQTLASKKDNDTKPKKKGYLDLINDREQALKEEGLTIGQHFFNQLLIDSKYRIKENIYLRSSYIEEFNRIWNQQQTYYPSILTEANKQKIRDNIIYYQRPLRSQKGLVSNCLFEKHHKATPKSSPLFQVAKIWQELNNIEITSFKAVRGNEEGFDNQGKRVLTLDEKHRLFNLLNTKGKLSTRDCLKHLGYKAGFDEYKLNIRNEKELEGNRTYAQIKKVLDKYNVNLEHLLKFDLYPRAIEKTDKKTGEINKHLQIDASFEQQPFFQLWHLLYSAEETESLIDKLQDRYGCSYELAKALANIDFHKQGYGSLSAKALRNILPYLQQGNHYANACKMARYNHSNFKTKDDNNNRELLDKLQLYPKNSLRQPVVEKIINQVINLINAIIDEENGYVTKEERNNGDFEIRVELARELKQSSDERNKTYSRNSRQDRRHKEIEGILKNELDFKRVTRGDIERYKLWEEFNHMSPYEPNKTVSLAAVFNQVQGDFYDIEHIIPKSRLFDDSFSNKTICPRRLNSGNLGKNQMTAFDFMKSKGDQKFSDYIEFIKLHLSKKDGISKAKFDKLMMPVEKIPKDFINRQLQETRFISREVRELLTQICRNVNATSGQVTDYLRHHWGYDLILQKLNWHKYEGLGKTFIETDKHGNKLYKIFDWSKRDDHRHHAIDALVIACTKQSYIHQLNNLNQTVIKRQSQTNQDALKEVDIKTQIPFTFQQVSDAVSTILISFKSGKKVYSKSTNKIKKGSKVIKISKAIIPRGFLHKETVYGRIKQYEEVSLTPKFDNLADVIQPQIKAQIQEYLNQFDNQSKLAFNSKNLQVFKEQYGCDKVTVYRHEHVVRYKLDVNFKAADVEYIVDKAIKAKVKEHLNKYGNNPKEAFKTERTVWLNEEKSIPIKSLRCFTGYTDLQSLHQDDNGNPIDFVSTQNNHHTAIYKDINGKYHEQCVPFWDAVKRRQKNLPVIITKPNELWDNILNIGFDDHELLNSLPQPDWQYVNSLQQNEMFILGLSNEELQDALRASNKPLISRHLYITWSISSSDYWFRHHLETKNTELKTVDGAREAKRFYRVKSLGAFFILNPVKVKINYLGNITLI